MQCLPDERKGSANIATAIYGVCLGYHKRPGQTRNMICQQWPEDRDDFRYLEASMHSVDMLDKERIHILCWTKWCETRIPYTTQNSTFKLMDFFQVFSI